MRQYFLTPTDCFKRRKQLVWTTQDLKYLNIIKKLTHRYNRDNISRTRAYLAYYKKHTDIRWSLLASMVSRNAGWNMSDLWLEPFFQPLSSDFRKVLYHTYERPNWLIFQDAYPQLLVYALSLRFKKPLFFLFKAFNISIFIESEWERYWIERKGQRLYKAQIINEQQIIEEPVLKQPFYYHKVFDTVLFFLQECFKVNAVIFPTKNGELFGYPVAHFQEVDRRIELGKTLYYLLFEHSASPAIREFALTVPHTGSRYDYEQFAEKSLASKQRLELRELIHVIHHKRLKSEDWFKGLIKGRWFADAYKKPVNLNAYKNKRTLLNKLSFGKS